LSCRHWTSAAASADCAVDARACGAFQARAREDNGIKTD
jgi:hypothetical protein